MEEIFVKSLLTDKVKVSPKYLGNGTQNILLKHIQIKFEGKCSHHGYIRPGSISIYKYSMGKVVAVSLNGDISYNVQFYADVCNPSPGSVLKAKVVNTNKFGILAECSISYKGNNVPVLEVIVLKNTGELPPDIDIESIKTNDMILIEVQGKKHTLNDKKISVVGKIVSNKNGNTKLEGEETDDAEEMNDEDDDIVPVGTDDDDESEDKSDAEETEDEEEEPAEEEEEEEEEDEEEFASDGGDDDGFFSDSDGSLSGIGED